MGKNLPGNKDQKKNLNKKKIYQQFVDTEIMQQKEYNLLFKMKKEKKDKIKQKLKMGETTLADLKLLNLNKLYKKKAKMNKRIQQWTTRIKDKLKQQSLNKQQIEIKL